MKRLLPLFLTILVLLSGCSTVDKIKKLSEVSSEKPITTHEYISSSIKKRDPLPLIKPRNKTAEEFFDEYLQKYEKLCEITTYEQDFFDNYNDYYEKYRYGIGFERSAEEKVGEELYYENHYLLAYAGWPLEEIFKYPEVDISKDSFGMSRVYEIPITNDDTHFRHFVSGNKKSNTLKKTLMYKNSKENISSTLEYSIKDGKASWIMVLDYKDEPRIFREKDANGKWVDKNK